MGQQRVAFVRPQRGFGARLGRRGNIAEQLRILGRADATHQLARGPDLRLEGVFVNRGLKDYGSLLNEDLREIIGRVDVVETAFALVGHPFHGVRWRVARNENGAESDAVANDGLHQGRRRRAGVAVAEDDDVLEVGGGLLERPMGQLQHAFKAAEVALVHAGDLRCQLLLVRHLL